MNAVAFDIATKLAALGLGTIGSSSSWGIYIDHLPDEPISAISVTDSPSPPPTITSQMGQNTFDRAMFQIRVRSTTYASTWTKILAIEKALRGLRFLVTETGKPKVRYKGVFRQSDFFPLASNKKGVYIRSVTFLTMRQEDVS